MSSESHSYNSRVVRVTARKPWQLALARSLRVGKGRGHHFGHSVVLVTDCSQSASDTTVKVKGMKDFKTKTFQGKKEQLIVRVSLGRHSGVLQPACLVLYHGCPDSARRGIGTTGALRLGFFWAAPVV